MKAIGLFFILMLSIPGLYSFSQTGEIKKLVTSLDSVLKEFDSSQAGKFLNAFEQTKKYGIAVFDWGLVDESEYLKGTGAIFKVYNSGTRTIKYITFNVTAFNAVDDPVKSETFRSNVAPLKGVGPIKPGDLAGYSFDFVWHSDLPQYMKITSLKIQFIDNSSIVITNMKAVQMDKVVFRKLSSSWF